MQDKDLYWLAGLLEGEGSFLKGPPSRPHSPIIALEMTDKDIMKRASQLLETKPYFCKARVEGWKPTYKLQLRGTRAAITMKIFKPLMGLRRQAAIDRALECFVPKRVSKIRAIHKDVIVEMLKSKSVRVVAKIVGCSHQTVLNYIKELS